MYNNCKVKSTQGTSYILKENPNYPGHYKCTWEYGETGYDYNETCISDLIESGNWTPIKDSYVGDEFTKETDKVDMVNSPKHYILFRKDEIEGDNIEVKHVVKAILERWQEQENISFDFYQAGCYKEMLQYLLRAPLKNNYEDVAKAKYYLEEILNEW